MITSLIVSSLDRRSYIFLAVLAVAALLVPVLNLTLPPTAFLHVPTYMMALLGKYICYAILALSIITQALTYALLLAFFRNDMGFGGNNGLTDFKDIVGFPVQAQSTRAVLYIASVTLLATAFVMARVLVTSTFGKVLVAIRDAESRTRFLGYRVESYKLFVFTVSACLAGLAGALYVPQVGIINPSEFSPANSIEAVIWVAVGGRGTLIGAVIGAFTVNLLKTIFTTGMLAAFWLFALGGLFILVTLAMPNGILGTIEGYFTRRGGSGGRAGQVLPKQAAE